MKSRDSRSPAAEDLGDQRCVHVVGDIGVRAVEYIFTVRDPGRKLDGNLSPPKRESVNLDNVPAPSQIPGELKEEPLPTASMREAVVVKEGNSRGLTPLFPNQSKSSGSPKRPAALPGSATEACDGSLTGHTRNGYFIVTPPPCELLRTG